MPRRGDGFPTEPRLKGAFVSTVNCKPPPRGSRRPEIRPENLHFAGDVKMQMDVCL